MKPDRRAAVAVLVLFLAPLAGFTQVDEREIIGIVVPREQQEVRSRVELSKSRTNYPVTPGDIYALTYRTAGRDVALDVLVESDYTLNLNVFGKLNAAGLTFPELKERVESVITAAYPNSLPYLTIRSVGMFQVYVTGEVPRTRFVTAWGLARLSEIVMDNLTPYSSTRDVLVVAADGRRWTYDLYRALYRGVLDEDPFVRPGDTVTLRRREREIELQGEVLRPGKYQLLPEDGVRDAIESYGGGFTVRAERSAVRLLRVGTETPQALRLDLSGGFAGSRGLQDGDILTVPSKLARLPVVVFEGAVAAPGAAAMAGAAAPGAETAPAVTPGAAAEGYSQIARPFAEGDTLYDALLAVRDSLLPTADLAGAYLVGREAERARPVDLEALLYRYDSQADLTLAAGDRIVIPRLRYYVSVIGAVANPGSYEYSPQRTYLYYLTLAGGIPPGITTENISIADADNAPRPLDGIIQPEDRIIVTEALIPVSGGVYSPGTYPFVPGKSFSHYLNLAGGINPEVNSGSRLTIRDADGRRVRDERPIEPGDRIYVRTNGFLYNFNRYFPLITSGLAVITATFTLADRFAR